MASLHPENGARIVLERERADGADAVYAVTVYEPAEVRYGTRATFSSDGVSVDAWEREPAEWIAIFTDRLLKSFAKSHAGGPWPRKITRWRHER